MVDRDEDIRELVRVNPGQASFEEYKCLRDTILDRAPCNLLVFGTGKDSQLWVESNASGKTVFLEHARSWIDFTRQRVPGVVIYPVTYDTRRFQWRWLLHRRKRLLMKDLPDDVLATDWDVMFVDAARSDRWNRPGRMKSIYTAATLARRSSDVDVFVHDCHRKVERIYCDTFIGGAHVVEQVGRLRHYRLARGEDRRV